MFVRPVLVYLFVPGSTHCEVRMSNCFDLLLCVNPHLEGLFSNVSNYILNGKHHFLRVTISLNDFTVFIFSDYLEMFMALKVF